LLCRDFTTLLPERRFALGAEEVGVAKLEAELNQRLERASSELRLTKDGPHVSAGPIFPTDYLARLVLGDFLAQYLSSSGKFEGARFREEWGSAGQALFRRLEALPARAAASQELDEWIPPLALRRGFSPAIERAIRLDYRRIDRPMPLPKMLLDKIGRPKDLRRVGRVSLQHMLVGTVQTLRLLDFNPKTSIYVDKTYSSYGPAIERLATGGAKVYSTHFDPEFAKKKHVDDFVWQLGMDFGNTIDRFKHAYRDQQKSRAGWAARDMWLRLRDRRVEKILAEDDGADLLAALANQARFDRPERFEGMPVGAYLRGVEQTRFGANRLRELLLKGELPFPVVDVADSPVKVHMESVVIGWMLANRLDAKIKNLQARGIETPKKILVAGFGAIGLPAAVALRHLGYEVAVYDIHEDPVKAAHEMGFSQASTDKAQLLGEAHIFLGTSGTSSLELGDFKRLPPGAKVFVGSTGSVEIPSFESAEFQYPIIEWPGSDGSGTFLGKEITVQAPANPYHREVVLKHNPDVAGVGYDKPRWDYLDPTTPEGKNLREIMLFKFPINFTGGPFALPPEHAQLIDSLMLLGSLQALDLPDEATGLIPLDRRGQRLIADAWMAEMRREPSMPPVMMELLEKGYRTASAALLD
jgi:hypothetical protein